MRQMNTKSGKGVLLLGIFLALLAGGIGGGCDADPKANRGRVVRLAYRPGGGYARSAVAGGWRKMNRAPQFRWRTPRLHRGRH
jgi:hypothetical protein